MKTGDIIKIIHDYYPQNISLEDIENYINSKEYQNRIKACHEARVNDVSWANFKFELAEYVFKKYDDELSDYSILGSSPCYAATLGFGKLANNESLAVSVLISIIAPLWSYRIIDLTIHEGYRFKCQNEQEKQIVRVLQMLVTRCFGDYELIHEQQHQIVLPDISTAFKSSPTIFEALFKEDLN